MCVCKGLSASSAKHPAKKHSLRRSRAPSVPQTESCAQQVVAKLLRKKNSCATRLIYLHVYRVCVDWHQNGWDKGTRTHAYHGASCSQHSYVSILCITGSLHEPLHITNSWNMTPETTTKEVFGLQATCLCSRHNSRVEGGVTPALRRTVG